MAETIALAVAGAVGAGATGTAIITFGVNLGLSAVASYALNALTPKPKIPGSGGFLVNEVNPTAPAEYGYGEGRKGGPVTHDEATDDNAILHRFIVLGAGEYEVVEVYLNDEIVDLSDNSYSLTDPSDPSDVYEGAGWVITEKWMEDNRIREPRIRIFWHEGNQTAATDTFANSSTATLANTYIANSGLAGMDNNFVGRDLTYLYVQLNIDAEVFAGGIPKITAKIRRKGIYDPRDDTNKITSNWALCVSDYLQANYGLDDPGSVNNTDLQVWANICDEDVALDGGGTQKRYELNGFWRADEQPGQVLSRMMPSGSGQLFNGQGKWNIRPGEYAGSIASFDLSDLRSAIQVETRTPRAQNYNAVRGVFNDKSQRYIEGEYPRISSATFLSVDGGFENVLDYDLPFETDGTRAQRLAKLALYRQREQIRVEADFNMRAASVQPGDVIDLTIARYGWTNKEFEVVGWTLKISETGTLCVRLSLKETSEAAFDWNAEESTFESNNTNLPDRFAVGSVTFGTPILSKIENPEGAALTLVTVPWSVTSPGLIADYVFEWRENNIDYASNGGFVEDSGSFTARERAVYDAYLKGLRRAPDQDGFDFYVSGGGSSLTALEVLVQITNSTEGQNQVVFQSVVTRNTSYELRTLKYGQRYDFRVYARNARGIRSDASALTYLVETDNTVPKAPTSFTATAAYQAVNLAWVAVTQNTDNSAIDDLYQYNVYRNTSNSFGGATLIAELAKNARKFSDAGLNNATLYYYWVTARDFSGNESAASTVASATTQAAVADGADGDRTYTGRLYYHILTATSPGLPDLTGRSFNESTGRFNSLPSNWEHEQPSVSITDTTVLEWSCQYRVTVSGALAFPQTAVSVTNDNRSNLTSAIQVTNDIESDNYVAGTTGWQIQRDTGDAEFNNITARGDITMTGGELNISSGGRTAAVTPEGVGLILDITSNSNGDMARFLKTAGTGDAINLRKENAGGSALFVDIPNSFDTNGIYIESSSDAGQGLQILMDGAGNGDGILVQTNHGSGSTAGEFNNYLTNGGHIQLALSPADGGYAAFAVDGDYLVSAGHSYATFTGSHHGMIDNTVTPEKGDILVDVSPVSVSISDAFFEVALSSSANQAGVIGVYARDMTWGSPTQKFPEHEATHNKVVINALGEGAVNVCGENGDIAKGDLIVTSSTPGKGMKQADDIVRGYTVAKAREAVTFSDPSEVKLVACIYLCG